MCKTRNIRMSHQEKNKFHSGFKKKKRLFFFNLLHEWTQNDYSIKKKENHSKGNISSPFQKIHAHFQPARRFWSAFFIKIWHSDTFILLISDTNGCEVVSAEFMKEKTRMIWETIHLIAARHKHRHRTFFSECLKPCSVTYLGHKTFVVANKRCWTWLDWK